ncbi:MAG: hypothetical protein AAGK32_18130 [Actinomycetota bacterium]
MAIAQGSEVGDRAGPFADPVRSVLAVIIVGFALTMLLARFEQIDDERERELRFGREAEAVQQTLSAKVADLSVQFETARAFIGATHPLPAAVFDDYFRRNFDDGAAVDPGILFVEEVDRGRFDALEARERRLGDPDFEVVELGVRTPGDALVVTRASAQGDVVFPLLGYEISFARTLIIPPVADGQGPTLRVAESAALLSGTSDADQFGPDAASS